MKAAADIAKSHFSWMKTYQTIILKENRHKPQNKQLILPIYEGWMLSTGLMCMSLMKVFTCHNIRLMRKPPQKVNSTLRE